MPHDAKTPKHSEIRVLVANSDNRFAQRTMDFLSNNGFNTRYATTGLQIRNILLVWKPDFILIDMFLPDTNALQFLKAMKSEKQNEEKPRIIIISKHSHEANIRECMRLGANDYLVQPFKYIDLLARLVLHKQHKRVLKDVARPTGTDTEVEAEYLMYLTDLILREALKSQETGEALHNLTKMIALALKAVRVSVVECDLLPRRGHVRGSSDTRDVSRFLLDLNKYPEIVYVLSSQKLLALDNLGEDPTMAFVAKQHKSISFNSMLVAPLRAVREGHGHGHGHDEIGGNDIWGILSVRMPDSKTSLNEAEIRFVSVVSQIISLVLQKGHVAGSESDRLAC